MIRIWKKLFSFVAISALLVNLLAPALQVYAQEVTPTPTVDSSASSEPSAPTDSIAPTETPAPTIAPDNSQATISATPVETIVPAEITSPTVSDSVVIDTSTTENQSSATLAPPTWQTNSDGSYTTINSVVLNQAYTVTQNDKVSVTFSKLPNNPGKLTIKEITLTPEQVTQTGALSDKAYDITSDMADGTFEYALTLPKPNDQENVQIKFAENLDLLSSAQTVDQPKQQTSDSVTVSDVNHFTIFVVSGVTPPSCTGASVTPPGGTTACYTTIQAAINAAAATPGETINVSAGTYTENLTISQNLSLIGVGDATHIIGGIDSNGASVTIQSLKITNQNPTSGPFYYGVKASANNTLTLENVTIDVLYYGIRMGKNDPSTSAVITINNSRIKGYAAIHFNGSNDALAVVNTGTVINVFNSSLVGTTSYGNSGWDDFAVIALAYTSGMHVNFTGTSSVANEFMGGALAKENLILFYFNADNNSVTGTPTYTNAVNSTTNAVELFESAYGPYTNTVQGQVVARYVQDTTEFEAALASVATTPIVVGRGDAAITTTAGTKTLNAGTTLLIGSNNTPTTISAGTTLVNNGAIIVEAGATFTNNGIIRGTGTISGTVDPASTGTIDLVAPNVGSVDVAAGTYNAAQSVTITAAGDAAATYYTLDGTTPDNTKTLSAGPISVDGADGATVTLKYISYDAVGNASSVTSVAYVFDKAAPTGTIEINGGAAYINSQNVTLTLSADADLSGVTKMAFSNGSTYSAWEAYATSKLSWVLSPNDGLKTVRVKFKDAAGNETSPGIPSTITVDTIKPIIALTGITPNIEVGGTYAELGATADDGSTVSITGSVNTNVVSSYTITYNATDTAGNTATPVTRTVSVVDTTIPVISILGDDPITVEINSDYQDTGAMATDNYNGDISNEIMVDDSEVDTEEVGTYTVYYDVDDSNSNSADQKTRTVNVVDSIDAVFDEISNDLATAGIASNMSDVTTNNIQNFSGLYFEKSITVDEITTKMGRLTFTAELDLSSDATQTFLQNLGTYMEANQGSMKFDATTATQLKEAGAEIKMYGVDALGYIDGTTPIIVRDDAGNILSEGDADYPTLSSISYVAGDGGTITFSTDHFTQFDLPGEDQTTPDAGGDATLSGDTTEVVLTDPDQAVDITIADGTDDPTIDVSSFITGGTGTLPKITIDSEKADIVIPSSTIVTSADATWNGVIAAPTVTTVTLPETTGETKTVSSAIEVGFSGAKLSFNKAVRILLPNQAGKRVGYVRTGIAFTEITSTCSADNQAIGDAMSADGDCKIDVGSDLVIWTKHFTQFAAYTQTTNSSDGGGTSSGGGSGLSDGLGCGNHDCSGNVVGGGASAGLAGLALAFSPGAEAGVLGTTTPSTPTPTPSKSPSGKTGEVKGTTEETPSKSNSTPLKVLGAIAVILSAGAAAYLLKKRKLV